MGTVLITVQELIEAAFGNGDENVVNFRYIHIILHLIAQRLSVLQREAFINANEEHFQKPHIGGLVVNEAKIKAGSSKKIKKKRENDSSEARNKNLSPVHAKAKRSLEVTKTDELASTVDEGISSKTKKKSRPIGALPVILDRQALFGDLESLHTRKHSLLKILMQMSDKKDFQDSSGKSFREMLPTFWERFNIEEDEAEEKIYIVNLMTDSKQIPPEKAAVVKKNKQERPDKPDSNQPVSLASREKFFDLVESFMDVLKKQYEEEGEEDVKELEEIVDEKIRAGVTLSDPLAAIALSRFLTKTEKAINDMKAFLETFAILQLKSYSQPKNTLSTIEVGVDETPLQIVKQENNDTKKALSEKLKSPPQPPRIQKLEQKAMVEKFEAPTETQRRESKLQLKLMPEKSESPPGTPHRKNKLERVKSEISEPPPETPKMESLQEAITKISPTPERSLQSIEKTENLIMETTSSQSMQHLFFDEMQNEDRKPIVSAKMSIEMSAAGIISKRDLKTAEEREKKYFSELLNKKADYVNAVAEKVHADAKIFNSQLDKVLTVMPRLQELETVAAAYRKRISDITLAINNMIRAAQEECSNMGYDLDDALDKMRERIQTCEMSPEEVRQKKAEMDRLHERVVIAQNMQLELAESENAIAAQLQPIKDTIEHFKITLVNRDEIDDITNAKVDVSLINGYVMRSQCDAVLGEYERRLENLNVDRKEGRWQTEIDTKFEALQNKVLITEVGILFADIQKNINMIQDRIDAMMQIVEIPRRSEPVDDGSEPARQIYRRTACISCLSSPTKRPPRRTGLQRIVSPTIGAEAPKFEDVEIKAAQEDSVCRVGRKVPHPIDPRAQICSKICGTPHKKDLLKITPKRLYKDPIFVPVPCLPCNEKEAPLRKKRAPPRVEPEVPTPEDMEPTPAPSEESHGKEEEDKAGSELSLERYLKYSKYWRAEDIEELDEEYGEFELEEYEEEASEEETKVDKPHAHFSED